MNDQIITSTISAISIISGSLIGALCSYIISEKMYKKELAHQEKKDKLDRQYRFNIKSKDIYNSMFQIRLDIVNAIFQSIRNIKYSNDKNIKKISHIIPVCSNYSSIIISINDFFSVKELSELYQLYAIIDKVSKDMLLYSLERNNSIIVEGYISILYKIYGDNYKKILLLNPDTIDYKSIINNKYVNDTFKIIFNKLENYIH